MNVAATNNIKVPNNYITERFGKEYYMYIRYKNNMKQKYNINIDIDKLNRKYDIKAYNKQ